MYGDLIDENAFYAEVDDVVWEAEEHHFVDDPVPPPTLDDVLDAVRPAPKIVEVTITCATGTTRVLNQAGKEVSWTQPPRNPRLSIPSIDQLSAVQKVQASVQDVYCNQCLTNQYITTPDLVCGQCRYELQCTVCRNGSADLSLVSSADGQEWFWICLQCVNSPVIPNMQPALVCQRCHGTNLSRRSNDDQRMQCKDCRPSSTTLCHQCKQAMTADPSDGNVTCHSCGLVYVNHNQGNLCFDSEPMYKPECTIATPRQPRLTATGQRTKALLQPSSQTVTLHRNLQQMTKLCQAMFHRLAAVVSEERRAAIVRCVTEIVAKSQKLHCHRIETDTAAALLQVLARESPPVSEKVFRAAWGNLGVPIRGTKSAIHKCKRLHLAYQRGLINYEQYWYHANSLQVLHASMKTKQHTLQKELTRKIRKVRRASNALLKAPSVSPWVQIHLLATQYAARDKQLQRCLRSYDASHWRLYLQRIRWQVQLLNYICSTANAAKWLLEGIQQGYIFEIAAYVYFVSYQVLLKISGKILPGRTRKFTGKCYQRLQIRREPFYMLWQWTRQNKAELPYMLGFTRTQRLLRLLQMYDF